MVWGCEIKFDDPVDYPVVLPLRISVSEGAVVSDGTYFEIAGAELTVEGEPGQYVWVYVDPTGTLTTKVSDTIQWPDQTVPAAEGGVQVHLAVLGLGKIKAGTFGLEDIPDYLELLVSACNNHPKIQKKSRKANLVFQFQVEGGTDFWIRIDRGRFSTGQGTVDNVNVTIRMDLRIAPGIFSGQVNAASAYMAKELAFIGPMKHGIAFRAWVNLVKQELGI